MGVYRVLIVYEWILHGGVDYLKGKRPLERQSAVTRIFSKGKLRGFKMEKSCDDSLVTCFRWRNLMTNLQDQKSDNSR